MDCSFFFVLERVAGKRGRILSARVPQSSKRHSFLTVLYTLRKKRLPSSGSLLCCYCFYLVGTGVPVGTAVLAVMNFAAA